MKGLALALASPQSQYANVLLGLAHVLLADTAYVERIKRHYAMFRAIINERTRRKKRVKRKSAGKLQHRNVSERRQ
jgi:hypothetical protein